MKILLRLSIFTIVTMCGYKEATAMNVPVSFARHTAIGLLAYSPLWIQQCINHGNAKNTENSSAMDIANKLLAASFAIPIAATSVVAPTIEKAIQKCGNITPSKSSRSSLVSSLLIAGIPTFSVYKDVLLCKYEQNQNLS